MRNTLFYRSPQHAVLALALITSIATAGDWPQWRGPARTGVSSEKGLLREWPSDGPKVLWEVNNAGVGYSSLAVVGDRLYTQGDLDGVEHILCLDARDGSVVWAVTPRRDRRKTGCHRCQADEGSGQESRWAG